MTNTENTQDWDFNKYHKPHLGEGGGYCPHCATIDHAKKILRTFLEERIERVRGMKRKVGYEQGPGGSDYPDRVDVAYNQAIDDILAEDEKALEELK